MTSHRLRCITRSTARGFTLLEALLALFIFATAVISLVEAINATGRTALLSRRERSVQARLETKLLEATRSPELMSKVQNRDLQPTKVEEGDVTFTTRLNILEFKNKDDQDLRDLVSVSVTAVWKEGRDEQVVSAETWVFPPMFQPRYTGRR